LRRQAPAKMRTWPRCWVSLRDPGSGMT